MSCHICDCIAGKVKTRRLYEDEDILAIFNPKAAAFGHAIIVPKKHVTLISQIPDELVKKMFFVAQQLSTIIFEAVGAEGTNIMINEGVAAGQKHAHAMINIIPRSKDDGMNFDWPQKQIPEDSMNKIVELLKVPEGAMNEEARAPVEAQKPEPEEKEETVVKKVKNYLVEHWTRRIPR